MNAKKQSIQENKNYKKEERRICGRLTEKYTLSYIPCWTLQRTSKILKTKIYCRAPYISYLQGFFFHYFPSLGYFSCWGCNPLSLRRITATFFIFISVSPKVRSKSCRQWFFFCLCANPPKSISLRSSWKDKALAKNSEAFFFWSFPLAPVSSSQCIINNVARWMLISG